MHRTRRAALSRAYSHRRSLEVIGRRRDRRIRAKGHERRDQDSAATISPSIAYRVGPTLTSNDVTVITARLVGDDAVLTWLRDAPDLIASGLARAIVQLGIELQRKIQEDELSGQILAVRSGSLRSSIDLQIDQSSEEISATVFSDSKYAHAYEYGFEGTVDVRASLRRITQAFGRPISEKTINVRAYHRRMELPQRSFMRSALEDMDPAIRDEVNAALSEALT